MTGRRVAVTQTEHPWKAVARTVLQLVIGLAVSAPLIVAAITGGEAEQVGGAFAVFLAVSAAITRLMAVPLINGWLSYVGLGAQPRSKAPAPVSTLTDEYHEAVRRDRQSIYPDDGKE